MERAFKLVGTFTVATFVALFARITFDFICGSVDFGEVRAAIIREGAVGVTFDACARNESNPHQETERKGNYYLGMHLELSLPDSSAGC